MRLFILRVLKSAAVVMSQFALGAALAAPITYSETASGDLGVTHIGTLDAGLRFSLPSGLAIDNTSFTFVTTLLPGTTAAGTRYDLLDAEVIPNAALASSGSSRQSI